jgi:hypothetical protein
MLRGLKFACFAAIRAGLASAPALRSSSNCSPAAVVVDTSAGHARCVSMAAEMLALPFMSDKNTALINLLELGGPEAAKAQVFFLEI